MSGPLPHRGRRAPRGVHRRGFTLVELMLASLLGVIVILACIGIFAAIERQNTIGRHHFDETLEFSLTHETVQRAMQLLVLSDTPMPVQPRTDRPGRQRPQDPPAEEPPAPTGPTETPRFILAYDPAHIAAMTNDRGERHHPQRLELALRGAPVFVPQADRTIVAQDESRRRRLLTFREEREANREAEQQAQQPQPDLAIAPGLRGVFEVQFDPGPRGGTYSLWWRQLTLDEPAGSASIPVFTDASELGRTRLLSNLTYCRWQVFKESKFLDECTTTWPDEIPGYITLEVITAAGTRHNWLFELGWAVGKDPGQIIVREAEAPPALQRPGQQQQGSPAGTNPASGRPNQPGGPLSPGSPSPRPTGAPAERRSR